MKLILASTSIYRKALLQRLEIPFTCEKSEVDEELWKRRGLSAEELATTLAREKTQAVAQRHPDAFVLGGDQVAEVDGILLDKPGTTDKALEQLLRLSGKSHRLWTAVHLIGPGVDEPHLNITTLHMRNLTQADLRHYIQKDHPLDCAGSYKLEASGIKLFERIDSSDADAIVGLPLMWVQGALLKAGFSFFPVEGR